MLWLRAHNKILLQIPSEKKKKPHSKTVQVKAVEGSGV